MSILCACLPHLLARQASRPARACVWLQGTGLGVARVIAGLQAGSGAHIRFAFLAPVLLSWLVRQLRSLCEPWALSMPGLRAAGGACLSVR